MGNTLHAANPGTMFPRAFLFKGNNIGDGQLQDQELLGRTGIAVVKVCRRTRTLPTDGCPKRKSFPRSTPFCSGQVNPVTRCQIYPKEGAPTLSRGVTCGGTLPGRGPRALEEGPPTKAACLPGSAEKPAPTSAGEGSEADLRTSHKIAGRRR